MRSPQWSSRSGSVLVEAAVVLPIFLALILAIMELGTVFFVRHAMLNAARDATRSLSIREVNASGASALAATRLPGLDLDFTITTSSDADASVDCWVDIATPISGAALNDPLGILGDGLLQVRVTMRKEE